MADHDLAAHLLCLPMPLTPPALRADCAILLAMRDVLAGDAWLNWEQSLPIGSWQGVKLGGEPLRVTGLYLADARLNGRIPPELAELDGLSLLDLARNRLTGPVPPALGLLENLVELRIENNRLSGPIPELRLSNLSFASLGGNDFGDTGHSAGIPGDSASVPAETGGGPMRAASPVPETVGRTSSAVRPLHPRSCSPIARYFSPPAPRWPATVRRRCSTGRTRYPSLSGAA